MTRPEDLARLDTVATYADGDGHETWRLEGPAGASFVHLHSPRCILPDLAALSFSTIGGIGAAVLPDFMCRPQLRSGQLVEVLPGWGSVPGICHAMFPARRAMVPAVRALIDFLAENLEGAEPHTLDF